MHREINRAEPWSMPSSASMADEQRTGREMFAVGIERFFRDLDGCAFEFVDQGQERNLAGVGHGKHSARTGDLAGQRRRIVKQASSST